MQPYNILVFPCGSEIGLEIFRSLKYTRHFNLFGASSVEDHGRFVYSNYIGGLPFASSIDFVEHMAGIVKEYSIHAIYPAMDSVIQILKENEELIGCRIITSPLKTVSVCSSKSETYKVLRNIVSVPNIFSSIEEIISFPVFTKPDIGYGSRGAKKINNKLEAELQLKEYPNSIFIEFLPGVEYTVDCFTDRTNSLRFVGQRRRNRIMNGISVNTCTSELESAIKRMAISINKALEFRGAWFFQIKENCNGEPVLMEVAARMAGSSAVYRCQGINFSILSLFDAFNNSVEVMQNKFHIELDRALENKYKIEIKFTSVYVDFDDALLINGKINVDLIKALYQFFNEGKKLILITKHAKDIYNTLREYRISELFDKVIHLKNEQFKFDFIDTKDSIFIDDSFSERKAIFKNLGIPVFSPDAVEALIN